MQKVCHRGKEGIPNGAGNERHCSRKMTQREAMKVVEIAEMRGTMDDCLWLGSSHCNLDYKWEMYT